MIAGDAEAPENETEEGRAAFDGDVPAGIPDFWLIALRNHPDLEDMASAAPEAMPRLSAPSSFPSPAALRRRPSHPRRG